MKASDLGVPSTNLENVPTKQERRDINYMRAVRNLTSTKPPEKLSRTELPEALISLLTRSE